METSGNMLVFVILAVAFAAVGVHLFLWSRRKSRLLRRFAEDNGLEYRREDAGELERLVNDCMALEDDGMGRAFGQVGDIVRLDGGVLFRGVEALDLVPWGNPQNTHHARTAITFPADVSAFGLFFVETNGAVRQRYPADGADADAVSALLAESGVAPPPCPLSLTLMRNRAVAYLEPRVTGSVNREHLHYLVELMRRLGASHQRRDLGSGA